MPELKATLPDYTHEANRLCSVFKGMSEFHAKQEIQDALENAYLRAVYDTKKKEKADE